MRSVFAHRPPTSDKMHESVHLFIYATDFNSDWTTQPLEVLTGLDGQTSTSATMPPVAKDEEVTYRVYDYFEFGNPEGIAEFGGRSVLTYRNGLMVSALAGGRPNFTAERSYLGRERLDTDAFIRGISGTEGDTAKWVREYENVVLFGLSDRIGRLKNTLALDNTSTDTHSFYPAGEVTPVAVRNFLYRLSPNNVDIEVLQSLFQYQNQNVSSVVSTQLILDHLVLNDPSSEVVQFVNDPQRHGFYVVTRGGRVYYGYTHPDGLTGWTELEFPGFAAGSRMGRIEGYLYYNTLKDGLKFIHSSGATIEESIKGEVEFLPLNVLKPSTTPFQDLQGRSMRVSLNVKAEPGTVIRLGAGEEFTSEHVHDGTEIQDHLTTQGDGSEGVYAEFESSAPFSLIRLAHDNVDTDENSYTEPGREG